MEIATFLKLAEEYPWAWIPLLAYLCLNAYVKVRSAPTRQEGWSNLLNELAQRISVTDWKGRKSLTLPGQGSTPKE